MTSGPATPDSDTTESEFYAFRDFDPENARRVLAHYVGYFSQGPVLELACGPGIFLDLLTARGVECRAVDVDEGMVAQARERGHEVALDDAVTYLRSCAGDSLNGLFAAHFLEHLDADGAQAVFTEAARVLRPGGTFVAVVPNAACRSVLAYDFWRDPTHVRFYDPVALEFFTGQAGLELIETGGNPANHPGPPPGLGSDEQMQVSDLRENVTELVLKAQHQLSVAATTGRRRTNPLGPVLGDVVSAIGHLLAELNSMNLHLAAQVSRLRADHQALLAELYQPNEVYVVVRKRIHA